MSFCERGSSQSRYIRGFHQKVYIYVRKEASLRLLKTADIGTYIKSSPILLILP